MPTKNKRTADNVESHSNAKYPYTNKPGSLRKLLTQIPTKPKPPKIVGKTLKTWGFTDSNDSSMLRVLKALAFLTTSGETTDVYAKYMAKTTGAAVLGVQLRKVYEELFNSVADPARGGAES